MPREFTNGFEHASPAGYDFQVITLQPDGLGSIGAQFAASADRNLGFPFSRRGLDGD